MSFTFQLSKTILINLIQIILISNFLFVNAQKRDPILKCAKNQVVNKLTVYEDGAIEAECGPMPCGNAGSRCIEDQSACRAETDIFSGMKWAQNEQSLLLRCCSYVVPNKIYVGTDLVSFGSYYTGGIAEEPYGKGGLEYDFVSNVRTEQGGVRVWVYRILCPINDELQEQRQLQFDLREKQKQFDAAALEAARQQAFEKSESMDDKQKQLLKQISENQDFSPESLSQQEETAPINPLRYKPVQTRQRGALTERLL